MPASRVTIPAASAVPGAPPPARQRRILSIDGAGVYGLISAVWLRHLCEQNPDFLAPGQIDLFAGISSGAINTLLLAKSADPRSVVLSGELEAFWTAPRGVFSNPSPTGSALSLLGLAPWYDQTDFLEQLERHFGQMTLAELPNKVLITTFNWTGRHTFDFSGGGMRVATPQAPGTPARAWGPKFFCTLGPPHDGDYRVVDIAYGAAAPPGLRPIRGGIGDAGTFTGNPAVEAIAAMAREIEGWDPIDHAACAGNPSADPVPPGTPMRHLDEIALLSLGDGACEPSYWLENFNLGMIPMSLLPTNPFRRDWFSPVWEVSVQAPVKEASYVARTLLVDRYHRLDANLMEMPMLLASLYARSMFLRAHIFRHIDAVTRSAPSLEVVAATTAFLRNGWREPWEALREAAHPGPGAHRRV